MRTTRRSLLLGGFSIPLAALAKRNVAFAASAGRYASPLIVVVSGVSAATSPDRVARLVEPFFARGVPLLLTVSPFDEKGRPLDRSSKLARWLRECLRSEPDGIEIGVHVEAVDTDDPYFQLRIASNAQAALSNVINEYPHYMFHAVVQAQTLTTTTPVRAWDDCSAMRAACIRSVVHLPSGSLEEPALQSANGGYWMTDTGLVNIFGSRRSSIRPEGKSTMPLDMGALVRNLSSLASSGEPIIVDVPLESLSALSDGDLSSYAGAIARTVSEATQAGEVRHILPRVLYRQSREKERRFVIVRVDDLRLAPATNPRQMAFTRELMEAGYPVSEAIIPGPERAPFSGDWDTRAFVAAMSDKGRYDVSTHGWLHTPSELLGNSAAENFRLIRTGISEVYRSTGRLPVSYVPPNNAFDENTLRALARAGVPLLSADKDGHLDWLSGMDRHGVLHVSNTVMFERGWNGDIPYFEMENVLSRIGEENDTVFSIHPLTANTPEKERRIFDTLEILSGQAGTALVNFDEYYKAVMPPMPRAERTRGARADAVIRDWRPGPSQDDDALKEDAALAWSYFEWGARNFHGMAPATEWIENGTRQGYPFVTMWDVASYIMAAISARRIGVIDEPTFEKTARRITAFLKEESFVYKRAKLPPTERRLSTMRGERQGFDSADTGRLLIALKILDTYTDGDFGVAKLVANWGFDAILNNGEMHIVQGGRAVSAHKNNYANYVARGYRLWGYDLKPVFDTRDPETDMDEAVVTLAEVERRGRIATEPHVTEEIELGGSPHGQLMADIVYSAQMKRFADTGILTCASEGPVTGSPFFTYQGYQIEGEGGQFVVDAPHTGAIRQTRRREKSLRAVSSKGAYLWYAARQGEYSLKLLELARKRSRMPGIGFSSGIPEVTGKPFEVSDINTNGIILEAIAYVLGGRKPFLLPGGGLETVEGI